MLHLAYDAGVLTGVVVFLLAVATIFQYLMGLSGVPELLGRLLEPLESQHWLFLTGVALMTLVFGMLLEGLPAAVVLIPVVFPIATKIGIHPVHFDIVQTAAVGIGLFTPPLGVGLLMALRFAEVSVWQHARSYWPYLVALLIGLMLIICIPGTVAVPAAQRRADQVDHRHSGSIAPLPASTAAMLSNARNPMALRVSTEALPICGDRITLSNLANRMS